MSQNVALILNDDDKILPNKNNEKPNKVYFEGKHLFVFS